MTILATYRLSQYETMAQEDILSSTKRFCECGCGQEVRNRFKHGHNSNGKTHPSWRGGRRITYKGYVKVWMPDHPNCQSDGCILEHRLVMEHHLGRYLLPTEVVHHINHVKTDNRIENLRLFSSHSEHRSIGDGIKDPNRKCVECGSNKTCLKNGRHPQWFKLGNGFRCNTCYGRYRYRLRHGLI